jgi:tetratricopeptide (TPR) repeat protein
LALQANKLEIADKAFQKELQLDPKSSSALYGIGEVHRARGHYDIAREFFERYAAAEPGNATVHAQLGGLAELNRDWARAISEYQRAIELDRSLASAKNNLAWLYAEHGGSVTVALQLAQEARSSLPQDPHVADTLGWVLVKAGSPESALPYLKECVAKIPGNAAYHYHLGIAYFQNSKNQEAKRELQAALDLQQSFEGSIEAKKTLELANAAQN